MHKEVTMGSPEVEAAELGTWWPTRKWWAATILAFGGILATWATAGWGWTDELSGAAITLLTQRVVAYLVPNDTTPGGVPSARGSKI
jgi:hypothetical protein